MSMRGEIISREYQSIKWVQDVDGKQYACYHKDLEKFDPKTGLSEDQKNRCMDTSQVIGDSW